MIDKIKQWIAYIMKKYEALMAFILKSHHVHVNREKFCRSLVNRFYRKSDPEMREALVQQALMGELPDILTPEQTDKAYRRIRRRYGMAVFCVSFLLTLVPEDLWIVIVSCVLDLYFFQCMVFRSMQKIMMLYGQPIDLDGETKEGIETILKVDRSGVMIGKYPLVQKMKSGLGMLAKQAVKKKGPGLVAKMSRSAFMAIRRQCIKWFSVTLTRENVEALFDMLIPLTCALISGIVSLILFVPMCNKLRKNILQNRQEASEMEAGLTPEEATPELNPITAE